ncbi:MAG: hypothetical protein ACPLZD_02115 [Candidatus Saccharicenans sp.]|nr:MAG: hypothetical protein C0168_07605 [Candidatus Aminicenantes bacterium]HEK84741.1 hypothetical protein [Candidatus Aminicenantes bacterium]
MKKIIWITILVLTALFLSAEFSYPFDRDDYQVIKKAVQENPKVEPVKEVKWFKVLVVDNKSGKEKVKITMPIALVEIFARCADNKEVQMKNMGGKLNIEELLAELKKAGPLSIVEINEEEETVKVWLE